jgi:endonuclease/exonuclease/phosphatase family metal-dependent hydrolase
MRFRLLTYNIHKGIGGVDRRYRLERIVEAIAHCAPDIVLLQEVDDGVPRSRRHRQVDMLGDALDLPHRAYQRNVRLRKGHYGNAILSRYPMYDIRDLELTVPLKKRRRAIVAHCRLHIDDHTRTVLLFNFHLGLAGYERTIQLRRFLNSDVLRHAHRHTPIIAAGDFNDVWGRLGKRVLEPAGFKPACHRIRTFPAFMPVRPLDRIFYRGDVELDHSFASHTENAKDASDHLPLVADFMLAPPTAEESSGQESNPVFRQDPVPNGAETPG